MHQTAGYSSSGGLTRRGFLKATVGSACTAPLTGLAAALPLAAIRLAPPTPARSSIKKAVLISMLPEKMSYTDRFKLARETGFEAVEAQTIKDQHQAEAIKKATD